MSLYTLYIGTTSTWDPSLTESLTDTVARSRAVWPNRSRRATGYWGGEPERTAVLEYDLNDDTVALDLAQLTAIESGNDAVLVVRPRGDAEQASIFTVDTVLRDTGDRTVMDGMADGLGHAYTPSGHGRANAWLAWSNLYAPNGTLAISPVA